MVVNEELKLLKTMPKSVGAGRSVSGRGDGGQGGWNEELK